MQTMYRIINSKDVQIGTLYESFDAAYERLLEYAKGKRGNWIPYDIEAVKIEPFARYQFDF